MFTHKLRFQLVLTTPRCLLTVTDPAGVLSPSPSTAPYAPPHIIGDSREGWVESVKMLLQVRRLRLSQRLINNGADS